MAGQQFPFAFPLSQDLTSEQLVAAEQYISIKRDNPDFRWGSRCLRGGPRTYSPCVLDRTSWEDFYLSLPLDYDVKNDPNFNLGKSSYKRLGDLGFTWPEPTTREALRTGYCGPGKNSLTRPAFLRGQDKRPEPAYRLHLTDRTTLHHLRADPLEGVIPFGRRGDMTEAKSITHQDYKWRKRCCAVKPESRPPTYESRVYRFIKTDLHGDDMVDRVVKFKDESVIDDFRKQELLKLKKAYLWPTNPITQEPLGGRLLYYPEDPAIKNREEIWPMGEHKILTKDMCKPLVIPDCKCQLLAHGPRKEKQWSVNWRNNTSYLDPTENCCTEVPYRCPDSTPAECCFCKIETKDPPPSKQDVKCPPKPKCR